MILALNRARRYDEALAYCDCLEKECGDDISAVSYRADIYLNTSYWQSAVDTAIIGHKLVPSQCLIAVFAFFEFARQEAEKVAEEMPEIFN